jgi:adenylate kinase family enzyme
MNKNLNKIIITGDAGRGKSTLAAKISEKLGIPHYSTDNFFYETKFTKIRYKKESIDLISKIYDQDKWIVEGTTEHLLQGVLLPQT